VKWARGQSCYPFEPNACYGPPKVNVAVGVPEIPDFLLVVAARDAEHLQILRQLGLKSAICVPIKARGRTLGTSLCFRRVVVFFTQTDLALAKI